MSNARVRDPHNVPTFQKFTERVVIRIARPSNRLSIVRPEGSAPIPGQVLDPPAEDWGLRRARPRPSTPAPTLIFSSCEPLEYHRLVPAEARYEVNKPDVVDESVDGEALIVHLGTGAYYSARGTADLAWQMIASGATCEAVASALGNGAGAELALPAIERFVGQLVDEGLVESRRGLGMFVNEGARDLLLKGERQRFLKEEWPRVRERIQRLGLSTEELLAMPAAAKRRVPKER